MTSKEALDWLYAVINLTEVHFGNKEDNNKVLDIIGKDLDLLESIKEVFKKVIYAPYNEIEFDNKIVPIPKVKVAEDFDKELFRQVLEQCGFEIKEK